MCPIYGRWRGQRFFSGRYHVLGGTLSALDGRGPEDLNISSLIDRAANNLVEIILATSATVDGQTTAHYVNERLSGCDVTVSVSHMAYRLEGSWTTSTMGQSRPRCALLSPL